MNTISTKIAASDLIKKIEDKLFLYKLFLALIAISTITTIAGLQFQWYLIIIIILGWYYHKDLKEIERLEKTYGL